MRFLLLISIFFCSPIWACGDTGDFDFGGYGSDLNYGESASLKGDQIQIDLIFLDELLNNATGSELAKNRNELFYLVANGNKKALHAGIKVLIHLIQFPEFKTECDAEYELWGKEEVAFVLSRNFNFHSALCKFSKKEWNLVVDYFEEHPKLWGMIYDPPWIHREAYVCESHK